MLARTLTLTNGGDREVALDDPFRIAGAAQLAPAGVLDLSTISVGGQRYIVLQSPTGGLMADDKTPGSGSLLALNLLGIVSPVLGAILWLVLLQTGSSSIGIVLSQVGTYLLPVAVAFLVGSLVITGVQRALARE